MIRTTLIDRYRIDAELGRGGMGVVYRGHDTTLKRDVAIKVMTQTGLGTEGRSRLLNEAQAIAKLNHSNIVTVHDVGETNKFPFVVMEYVEGSSLYEHPPESIEDIIAVSIQVFKALEHAHDNGIIHRDLKPENIVIDTNGAAKLMDFGLARSVTSRLTTEGTIVGTFFYLAPEQALGQGIDHRADLYSLGVMLYELSTGRLPFEDADPVAVISQHLHAPVVPPRAKNAEIPPVLNNLILQLLKKDPGDRPTSAGVVRQALESPKILEDVAQSEELSLLDRIVRGRLVGREMEVEEARSLWNKAMDSEGQTLLVSGETGIGKTRLMREIAALAEVSGGLALIGASYSEGGAPYAAFGQIIRQALSRAAVDTFDLPDFVLSDLLTLAPGIRTSYPDIPPNPVLDPQTEQQRLFENVVTFCKEFSERNPLLLVVDDIHWADSGTLGLFRHLSRRTRRQRVLLLGTYREVELDEARPFNQVLSDLNRERLAIRLKLKRLNRKQSRQMLAALFAEEITDEFLEGIYHETEGNPYFIEEVCKALVENGELYYQDGEWHRPDMDELEIPQSIRVAIQSRVGKLPSECQEALRMAAVLGREFDFDTLVEASDQDDDILIDALELAEKDQLIEEMSADDSVGFAFVHALIPTTLTESVSTLRRRRLHRNAAAAIARLRPNDFETLAFHYGEAGNREQALEYYTKAGEQAADAYANQEAETYFRSALDLETSDVENAELLSNLADVTVRLGRQDEGIAIWKEAADLYGELGKMDRIARCYSSMARARWWAGDAFAALELCKHGLDLTKGSIESAELANLIHETARAHYFLGDSEQAEPLCYRSLEMARRFSAKRIEADALTTFGILPSVNKEDAISALEDAIAICQEERLLVEESRAHNNLGVILGFYTANFRRGLKHYLQGADISRQLGDLTGELFTFANAASNHVLLGELDAAEELITYLHELHGQLPESGASSRTYTGALASFEHGKRNLEKAAGLRRELFEEALETNSAYEITLASINLGSVLLELGVLDEAVEVLQRGVEGADQLGQARVLTRSILSLVLARKNDTDRARQVYEEAKEIFAEYAWGWSEIVLRMAHAGVVTAERRWDEMPTAFEQAAERLKRSELRFWRAGLLRDWAEAHLQRGQPEDLARAKHLLNEALEEYEDMGSPLNAERIKEKLQELNKYG